MHFNAAGLLDHATQWHDILRGASVIALRNGGFEDNRTPAITNLPILADGTSHLVTTVGANDSPMVLDWSILAARGVEAADGGNGFHNPTTGTFADASVSWTTGDTVSANQLLAIRVVKEGGAGTVLDFDKVRLTTLPQSPHPAPQRRRSGRGPARNPCSRHGRGHLHRDRNIQRAIGGALPACSGHEEPSDLHVSPFVVRSPLLGGRST